MTSLGCRESRSYTSVQAWLFVSKIYPRFETHLFLSSPAPKPQNANLLNVYLLFRLCSKLRTASSSPNTAKNITTANSAVVAVKTEEESTIALATMLRLEAGAVLLPNVACSCFFFDGD